MYFGKTNFQDDIYFILSSMKGLAHKFDHN
jgi:hypothetical protein